jgi:hypothetical protein
MALEGASQRKLDLEIIDHMFREASASTLDKISEVEAQHVPKIKKAHIRKVNQTPRPEYT